MVLAIIYLILTVSIIIFSFSIGRYPFLNQSRNFIFIASGFILVISNIALKYTNITLSDYEIFLLFILSIFSFRQGRRRKYLYGSILFKKESSGSFITVEENLSKNTKIMKRDGKILSGVNLQIGVPTSNLYKYPHFVELLPVTTKNILSLGGGACVYPSYAYKANPKLSFSIIENDPIVIEASKKYFNLPLGKKFKLIESDALSFLKKKGVKKYDLIFVDLGIVLSRLMPFENEKFVKKKSLTLYKKALNGNGLLLMNIISTLKKEDHDLVSEMLEPFKKDFNTHLLFVENPKKGKSEIQDIIHIFSRQKISIASLSIGLMEADENELSYSKYTFENLLRTYWSNKRSKNN